MCVCVCLCVVLLFAVPVFVVDAMQPHMIDQALVDALRLPLNRELLLVFETELQAFLEDRKRAYVILFCSIQAGVALRTPHGVVVARERMSFCFLP